jgi:SAM-dependent methyltransferase
MDEKAMERSPGALPGRIARRIAQTPIGRRAAETIRQQPVATGLDDWLVPLFGDELGHIDEQVADAGPEGWSAFRELDDDLWALLLTLEYESFPGIRGFLPGLPKPALQQMWNGTSGAALAAQSVCFYRRLKQAWGEHGSGEIASARVLDFGCGWGRLTRMLARDVDPGNLYGCDPVESILDVCRENGVPAELARSEFLPESVPFDDSFDMVFSFSVFTHISERAHLASLEAIHDSLEPGGLFVATIRPPSYLDLNPLMKPVVDELPPDRDATLATARYLFAPHESEGHPQFGGQQMDYGETVITLPYVRENWTRWFDLLDVAVMTGDMYQVVLTLRRPD